MQKQETLKIYTEDKAYIGHIKREDYHKVRKVDVNGKSVSPWVECVTCFVLDRKDKSVAIQKRAKTEINPGELDLVSGFVKEGEISRTAMIGELQEEMKMSGFSRMDLARELIYCGNVKLDFSKNNNPNNRNNLKCFTSIYAIEVESKKQVCANENSVDKIGWADYEEVKKAIRASIFRFPYTQENSETFEKIFKNVDKVMEGKNLGMSLSEYEREWR